MGQDLAYMIKMIKRWTPTIIIIAAIKKSETKGLIKVWIQAGVKINTAAINRKPEIWNKGIKVEGTFVK